MNATDLTVSLPIFATVKDHQNAGERGFVLEYDGSGEVLSIFGDPINQPLTSGTSDLSCVLQLLEPSIQIFKVEVTLLFSTINAI